MTWACGDYLVASRPRGVGASLKVVKGTLVTASRPLDKWTRSNYWWSIDLYVFLKCQELIHSIQYLISPVVDNNVYNARWETEPSYRKDGITTDSCHIYQDKRYHRKQYTSSLINRRAGTTDEQITAHRQLTVHVTQDRIAHSPIIPYTLPISTASIPINLFSPLPPYQHYTPYFPHCCHTRHSKSPQSIPITVAVYHYHPILTSPTIIPTHNRIPHLVQIKSPSNTHHPGSTSARKQGGRYHTGRTHIVNK